MAGVIASSAGHPVRVSRGGGNHPFRDPGAGTTAEHQSDRRHGSGGTRPARCLGDRWRSGVCAGRPEPQLDQQLPGAAGDRVGCRCVELPLVAPKPTDLAAVVLGRWRMERIADTRPSTQC